jgi:hypothetical protein
MSKNILSTTLLLLVFFGFTLAQGYRQYPLTGGRWKIEQDHGNIAPLCNTTENSYLYTDGDTTIGGYLTVKIASTNGVFCAGQSWCFGTTAGGIQAYIYQDSAGKVYTVDPSNGALHKVMDYSLQPGDTLREQYTYRGDFDYRVDSVDTVTFIDNIPRKRLYLTCQSFLASGAQAVWIEGMGDLYHGPLPVLEFENAYNNRCYKEENILLATNPIYFPRCISDCDELLARAEPRSIAWQAAPNPSEGTWRLSQGNALQGDAVSVRVIDVCGRTVLQQAFASGEELLISLPQDATPGLYTAQVYIAEGQTQSLKLIKR